MGKKSGFVHHALPILILIVASFAFIAYVAVQKGLLKKPSFLPGSQQPKVELKTQYSNPFDKETQYVNPFQEFKNPFNNI